MVRHEFTHLQYHFIRFYCFLRHSQCAAVFLTFASFSSSSDSGQLVLDSKFNDFLHGLHRQDEDILQRSPVNADPISGDFQAIPTYSIDQIAPKDAEPSSHIRRKRYMSFRPLFVYRLQAAEARASEERKEAARLHSSHDNTEWDYDY